MSATVVSLETCRARKGPGASVARQRWQAGLAVPARITFALDLCALHGPSVDEACGVTPPTVDRWEHGLVYPTWDQLCRLAVLTGFPVGFFTEDAEHLAGMSARFCRVEGYYVTERTPSLVLAFARNAINRTLGGNT